MNSDQRAAERLFEAARQLANDEQRAAFLQIACGQDFQLRDRVAALLRSDEQAGTFLEELPNVIPIGISLGVNGLPNIAEKPGDRIGRYKLLEQIGEGGCGIVYVAEQEQPIRRRVALKVIKLGMDTRQVIARFEAERQALALMDHPNISRVLDAGATETGRPFFVMELVHGIKITNYCDRNNFSTAERLQLFTQVCHAIQHAHQKGIIHRDIKPSNILVTLQDGVPVPKVIDFGIAKATTDQRLTDKTVYTAFEQFIGTPAYMSPEQAEMSALDVDTRSDIYALGVMLYELLTGRTPFDPQELLKAGVDEMRRIIREKEPLRPSTRLSALEKADLTSVAKQRHAEPPKLVGLIRGDLDWIVMKCLEKDRTRRYETANGLAMDLKRHLDHEPVIARPPTVGYRLRKLVRRNKLTFAAVTTILTVLMLGVVASTWQTVRATRAEHDKTLLYEKAQKAQAGEAKERDLAVQRLYNSLVGEARATRMAHNVGYRNRVFELLQQARALNVPQRDLHELRREAGACLGDFVGLSPVTFSNSPGQARIVGMEIDPTGHLAAFLLADGAILVRELPSGKEVAMLTDKQPATSFCFSHTGDWIVSLHVPARASPQVAGTAVRNWARAVDGRWCVTNEVTIPGAGACVRTRDRTILLVNSTNSVELVDLKDLLVIQRIQHLPQEPVTLFDLSPDGRLFAVAGQDVLEVWDVNTGRQIQKLNHGLTLVLNTFFSSDGRYLACIGGSGCAIYSTDDFRHIATLAEFATEWTQASLGAGGILALPLYQQNRVRLWDALRGQDLAFLDLSESVTLTAFSPNGAWLLASAGLHAWLFRLSIGTERLSLPGQSGGVPGACFSPDGSRIASVGKDRTLKVWDAETGRQIWQGGPLPYEGMVVSYSPDGQLLVTTTYGLESVWVWDALAQKKVLELGSVKPGAVWSAQFSRDGRYLVTASTGDGITVWSLDRRVPDRPDAGPTAKVVNRLEGQFWSSTLAPDDQHVAFFNFDVRFPRNPFLWDWRGTNPPLLMATEALNNSQIVSFTPDSRQMIILDWDRNLRTIDVQTRNPVSTFPTLDAKHVGGWAEQPNLCLSPDGKQLAITSASRLGVDIWDPKTGLLLCSLPEQRGTIFWLAWSPNSQRLAVSRSDGDVSIWNLRETERILAKLGLSAFEQGESAQVGSVVKLPATAVENRLGTTAMLLAHADLRARSKSWKEAAEDLSKAMKQDPDDTRSWVRFGPLLVDTGNLAGYHEHCRAMLTRFHETSDPVVAARTAETCLLLPVRGSDLSISSKLADTAITGSTTLGSDAFCQLVKGLAEYRQGHFSNAIGWVEKVLLAPGVKYNLQVQAYAVLALARHDLNHFDEARAALMEGVKINETRRWELDLGPSWHDWLTADILLREAKGKIDNDSSAPSATK